ncbi:acyclic terpene utilization AtuA family protein [Nocardioides aequoreus]|uniref:acyclic terpene utilization AtuA family protein n=1 Tax=Nocardioides aequoreus TaxID=397278 RepID=UPI0004C42C09|nr:acyclic terpene utilization AtuA family protein [Nocardioides aequoreus]
MSEPIRIANCSGFYGDRLAAMREVVTGGPVDVVTGDYLAELTMLILGRDRMRDASLGYAKTFVRQLEDCLGEVLERGVKVVANAGGLNPGGLVAALREVAGGLGLDPAIAHVDGDDLLPRAQELGWDGALTANAYLGGLGVARALGAGADVVVTGRVTDASLVVGPAAWHHGWGPEALDELAGAVVAGHVVECGTQATGGNFSGFLDLPRDARPLGFPLAEVAADGSSVITKHEGTGGAVTVDTVTAQLMYEVQSRHYLGPDVTVDLDSVRLAQVGEDRVAVSGVRGLPPPETLKVCVNELGGWRSSVELVLTGLDVEAKADWVREQLAPRLDAAEVVWSPVRAPAPDADTEEGASVLLRCTVKDADQARVDRAFSSAVVELALASYPGFTMTAPPGRATPYGVYRAAYVDRALVTHTVHLPDGTSEVVPDAAAVSLGLEARAQGPSHLDQPEVVEVRGALAPSLETAAPVVGRPTRRVPLGTFCHARSGDKGGDANVGVWVGQGDQLDERTAWLLGFLTPDRVRELLPEAAGLEVEVHPLPHLHGVNVLLRGLLGDGVAAGTRFDPQAKGLGEWLRSRYVEIPEELL